MGCGCKKKKESQSNGEGKVINKSFKESISKALTSVILLTILIIASPLIMLGIWYLVIMSIYGKNSGILDLIFKAYIKKGEEDDDLEEELDSDDYELVGVDIIN